MTEIKLLSSILTVFILSATMLASCGSNKDSSAGSASSPEQIDSAVNAGREAARAIILRAEWKDSMEFQNAVLDAYAGKSVYTIRDMKDCEAAYDSAFISTIRATRPDLAARLQ